jgi:hypothetical protein
MDFFGHPNAHFFGLEKYYYIVVEMKIIIKGLNLLKHYELTLQL